MTVIARYYDEPFLNPVLSPSIQNAAYENARKIRLMSQYTAVHGNSGLCGRQIARRAAVRAYTEQNYTPAAIKAGFGE